MVCSAGTCEQAPQAEADPISAECRPVSGGSREVVALQTVQFDFNKFDLTVETTDALDKNARCMQQAPDIEIVIEGHCDERGTEEYNLALGERRAQAVRSYLANLGVDTSRFRIVSKGKNEPVCDEMTDACHDRNRRVQFLQSR